MVSFAALPYGLQRRIVELAPVKSLVRFEETGHLAAKLSQRLRNPPVETVKFFNSTDTEMLKQGDVFRVCKILYLDCQRPRKYQETLELICGSYTKLEICGSYPWRLLIGLIRPKVSTVEMGSGIKLAKNEVDVFVNQLFTKMSNQSLDVHVTGKKMVKLLPRLKIMARAFMHQRRRDGLKVAYIKIDFTHRAISSHLIEG